jgi:hypothetical protein
MGFCVLHLGLRIPPMNEVIGKFLQAHDRYLELDVLRTQCSNPPEREFMHLQILTAYMEVQSLANLIAGLQFADGMDFAELQ